VSKARLAISHLRVLRSRTSRSTRAADRADFEVNPHFAAAGLPYSFVQSAPALFFSSAALRRKKKTDPQHGPCSCKSWPRQRKADGGQEELDRRCVSLPSGLPGGSVTCSYRACVRASPRISSYSYSAKRYSVKRYSYSMAVRTAALFEAVRGNLRTNRPDSYNRTLRVRVPRG
jgi:hypothetical protein